MIMLLNDARWNIICLAAQKQHGIQLRSAPFRLLVSMLLHVEELEWARTGRLVSWPALRQIERDTGLREGSISHARQQLIGAGLITPLSTYRRGGNSPLAAYQIHLQTVHSPFQEEAQRHVAKLQHRGRDWSANGGPSWTRSRRRAAALVVHGKGCRDGEASATSDAWAGGGVMLHRCAFQGCPRSVEWDEYFALPPEGWSWLGGDDWGPGVPEGMYCKAHADALEEQSVTGELEYLQQMGRGDAPDGG
jgi:hypothetical protein